MDKQLSEKISIISFVSIIMVVYIHSDVGFKYAVTNPILNNLNIYIQNFISQGLNRIAVPLFFIISGYLFFININLPTIASFLKKFKTRFFSLFIPYVAWCSLAYIFVRLIRKTQFIYILEIPYIDGSINNFIYYIKVHAIPFQFWFLRDLMCYIVLTPIIYILIKRIGVIALLPFGLLWLGIIKLPNVWLNSEGMLFFLAGSYLGIKKINPNDYKIGTNKKLFLIILWFLILLIKTYILSFCTNPIDIRYLHHAGQLIGIFALWTNYEKIFFSLNFFIKKYKLTQYTFFIYCAHEPLQHYIKEMLICLLGNYDYISLILYFIVPILIISFCIFVAMIQRKYVNAFYKILIGSR